MGYHGRPGGCRRLGDHPESHREGREQVIGSAEHGNAIAGFVKRINHSESYLARGVTTLVQGSPLYPKSDWRPKRVGLLYVWAVRIYQHSVRQHSQSGAFEMFTGEIFAIPHRICAANARRTRI